MLDIWPLLPIVVRDNDDEQCSTDNIFSALEHNDRICQLELIDYPVSQAAKLLAALQKPFPVLTHLILRPNDEIDEIAQIDLDLFLGGSGPSLQTLRLYFISFPGLPDLLLSATRLVYLQLWYIPHSGYISTETMVTCLSVLTRLERLEISLELEPPLNRRDRRSGHSPFTTRILLPVLTRLWLQGTSEYLEDFVARIDAPLLDYLTVSFFHETMFNTPQLIQFINRSPKFKAHDQARLVFDPDFDVWITLPQAFGRKLRVETNCYPPDQLSSLAQICSSSVPRAFISAVEHLYIVEGVWEPRLEGEIERGPAQWLDLLHPFTAVKCLYISREYTLHVAFALQELVGERAMEVLPTLQKIFLETHPYPLEPVQEAIGQFVAVRQLVGQHIALSPWNGIKDVWEEMEDYETDD
jgi:hypothetical protein